ncbi:MAG: hypothetical protein AAF368_20365, partial [Planctomycetota bacterium]
LAFRAFGESLSVDLPTILVGDGYETHVYDVAFDDPQSFCSAELDPSGCAPCPCGNNAPAGQLAGCTNSTGSAGRLHAIGEASLTDDRVRMNVTGLTPSSFAVLVSATLQLPQAGVCAPGTGIASPALDGLRCIGVGALRHGTRSTDSTGADLFGWGVEQGPSGGLVAATGAQPGQTRFFQAFYRDLPTLGCLTGVNTTNGMALVVRP